MKWIIIILVLFVASCQHNVEKEIPPEDVELCAQVITPAIDPGTGECVDFSTPCDVPEGWELCENEITGESISNESRISRQIGIGESFADL